MYVFCVTDGGAKYLLKVWKLPCNSYSLVKKIVNRCGGGGQRLKTYWHLFVLRSLMRDGMLTQPYRVTRTCVTSWWVPLIMTETDKFHRFHARKNHKCSANNHTQITTRSNLITRNPPIKRKKTTTPNVLNGTKIFPHLLFFWLIDLKRNRCNKNNSLGNPLKSYPVTFGFDINLIL